MLPLVAVFILLAVPGSLAIVNGVPIKDNSAAFVVYIIEQRDKPQTMKYWDKAWMCVGAVISKKHVITSGACLSDVGTGGNAGTTTTDDKIWVISGTYRYPYRNETSPGNVEVLKCINQTKRHVTHTYVAQTPDNGFEYKPIEKWVTLDIGIAEVDPMFDFSTKEVPKGCDYAVTMIDVNFDAGHDKDGMSSFVYGWGHTESYRGRDATENMNSDELMYSSVKTISKDKCVKEWPNQVIRPLIKQYMVCTKGRGDLDDKGEVSTPFPLQPVTADSPYAVKINGSAYMKECATRRRSGQRGWTCVPDQSCLCPSLRGAGPSSLVGDRVVGDRVVRDGEVYWRLRHTQQRFTFQNNNNGFCQNDHGAPLVAWVGPKKKLIGVASTFLVRQDETLKCEGPHLYMSTFCNGAFIKCVISDNTESQCAELKKEHLRMVVTTVYQKEPNHRKNINTQPLRKIQK